jgi:hypothetical protein
MLPLCQPPLTQQTEGAYRCADIRALYYWLEAHGYHYFGSFGPEQYGRFSYLEIALGDSGPMHHASSIEVHLNGAVVAMDALARRLLDTICG